MAEAGDNSRVSYADILGSRSPGNATNVPVERIFLPQWTNPAAAKAEELAPFVFRTPADKPLSPSENDVKMNWLSKDVGSQLAEAQYDKIARSAKTIFIEEVSPRVLASYAKKGDMQNMRKYVHEAIVHLFSVVCSFDKKHNIRSEIAHFERITPRGSNLSHIAVSFKEEPTPFYDLLVLNMREESLYSGLFGSRSSKVRFTKKLDPPHFGVSFSMNNHLVGVNVAYPLLAAKLAASGRSIIKIDKQCDGGRFQAIISGAAIPDDLLTNPFFMFRGEKIAIHFDGLPPTCSFA